MTLDHKTSLKILGYICSNSQKYIAWVKIIYFSFMPKIIRIRSCSMKIFCKFPTINISKLNFWLVICTAKNFIWTTLKAIFSVFWFFLHPQIPDFQIVVSQPNIVLSQESATRGSRAACGSFIPLQWLPVAWVYNTRGRCPPRLLIKPKFFPFTFSQASVFT